MPADPIAPDPWDRFRHRPRTGATRLSDEDRYWGESRQGWVTAAWWLHGATYAAAVLWALGDGDPAQWRWIVSPLLFALGVFSLVRPQAAFEVENPRWWFRRKRREPSRLALRRGRVSGGVAILGSLFVLVLPTLSAEGKPNPCPVTDPCPWPGRS